MTSRAYTRPNPMFDGIDIALTRHRGADTRGPADQILTWTRPDVKTMTEQDHQQELDPSAWLTLQEDDARALYEALGDHFGHAGHDIRALRKDYDAERGRVDKLITALIGGTR